MHKLSVAFAITVIIAGDASATRSLTSQGDFSWNAHDGIQPLLTAEALSVGVAAVESTARNFGWRRSLLSAVPARAARLQNGAGSSAVRALQGRTLAQSAGLPAAAVEAPQAEPTPKPTGSPLQQGNFGFSINNNVAFVGVAIVIALLISCFWGACGVYRRRQLVASRSGRFPGISNRAQPAEEPIKLTAQPVIVLQPDSTIAYTFRDLDEAEGDKDAGHLKSQDPATASAAAMPPAGAAEGAVPADAAAAAAVQHSTPAGSSAAGEGATAAAPGDAGAAAREGGTAAARTRSGRAGGSLQPQAPLFALGADAEPSVHAASAGAEGRSPMQTLQSAGILRGGKETVGVPVMLEWDLRAALESLDLEQKEASAVLAHVDSAAAAVQRSNTRGSDHLSRAGSQNLGGGEGRLSRTASAVQLESFSSNSAGGLPRLSSRGSQFLAATSGSDLSRHPPAVAEGGGSTGSFSATSPWAPATSFLQRLQSATVGGGGVSRAAPAAQPAAPSAATGSGAEGGSDTHVALEMQPQSPRITRTT